MDAQGQKERERERERAREKDRGRDYYDDNRRDRDRYRDRDHRQTSSNNDDRGRRPQNGKARKGQATKRQARQDSDYDYSPTVQENSRNYRKKPLDDINYKDDKDSYDPVYEPIDRKHRAEPRGRRQEEFEPYSSDKPDFQDRQQEPQPPAKKKKPKKKKEQAGGPGHHQSRREDDLPEAEYVPIPQKHAGPRIQQPAPRAKDYYYERKY